MFDFGGGMFDVMVFEYVMSVIEVYVFVGDNFFGGEDFIYMLVDEVLKCVDVVRIMFNESELVVLYVCVEVVKCSN